jgi:hypothetical protein
MFPTFGRGEGKGQAVPRWERTYSSGGGFGPFGRSSVFRIASSPSRYAADAGNQHAASWNPQGHEGILRHASIRTTGDIYVQTIDASVQQAVNSRTAAVLVGCVAPVEDMGLGGRNIKRSEAIRRSSAKLLEEATVSY